MKRYKQANEGIHAPEEVKKRALRPAGKSAYPRWAGTVAAALAVVLIGGAALWPGRGEGDAVGPENSPMALSEEGRDGRSRSAAQPGAYQRCALSLAAYPETAQYPSEEDYVTGLGDDDAAWEKASSAYSEAYDAWWEDQRALRSETDYTGVLDQFFTASTAQLLSGAGEDNRIYSPLNVYMALSMLAETTGGQSRQQILDLLQADSIDTVRTRAADLWRDNYQDDGKSASILANSLWLREGMSYSQDTLNRLAQDYYASSFSGQMGSAEYNQALQDWLNDQSRGLLAEQAGCVEMNPETVLALASTLYFKAAWSYEFAKELTSQDLFHAPSGDVETDFMRQTIGSTYYWGEHFSAVQLSFQEARSSMWLILPDEGYTVDELLQSGEAMEFLLAKKHGDYDEQTGEITGGWPGQKYMTVRLSMPKFDVSSDLDLTGGLKALGVTDIFDAGVSDFEPLGADTEEALFVSKVQHAARVTVDEDGCEAAAFTVLMVEGTGAPPEEEIDFTLDRPFFFAITGGWSGLPLFTGVVNQP